jgi:hypothetical protein
MPFKSRKQERYLQINEPEIYRDWVEQYGHFKGAEAFSAECVLCTTPEGYWRGWPLCSSSGQSLCVSCCPCPDCHVKWSQLEIGEATLPLYGAESFEAERGREGKRVFVVSSVDYETDGEDVDLPQNFTFTLDEHDTALLDGSKDMQEIADLLVDNISDETGWLVQGFYFQERMPDGTLVDLDAESFSAEFAAEASYCSNFNDHQWIPFGSEEMSCDKCDAIVTPETIKLASEDMFADLDGITRDEKGMRHSPHKKCPDCGAKPTSSWIDPGKCECGRVMNPSEYTNIRFSAELKRDSCCCGATKSKPCACMIQGVMECNATCPCSLEKSAETFAAHGLGGRWNDGDIRENGVDDWGRYMIRKNNADSYDVLLEVADGQITDERVKPMRDSMESVLVIGKIKREEIFSSFSSKRKWWVIQVPVFSKNKITWIAGAKTKGPHGGGMLEGYYHTLSDAVRSIEWWFLDDDGLNMANWLEGSWDAESFSAEMSHADKGMRIWEMVQQNLNNPLAVEGFYATFFGEDTEYYDGMDSAVIEAVKDLSKNPEWTDELFKEYGLDNCYWCGEDSKTTKYLPFDEGEYAYWCKECYEDSEGEKWDAESFGAEENEGELPENMNGCDLCGKSVLKRIKNKDGQVFYYCTNKEPTSFSEDGCMYNADGSEIRSEGMWLIEDGKSEGYWYSGVVGNTNNPNNAYMKSPCPNCDNWHIVSDSCRNCLHCLNCCDCFQCDDCGNMFSEYEDNQSYAWCECEKKLCENCRKYDEITDKFYGKCCEGPLKYLSITGYYPKVGRSRRYPVYTGDRWNPMAYGEVSMTGDARGKWNFYWSDGDYGIEGDVRKNKSYYTLSPLYINGHFMDNEGPTFQSRTQWGCVLEAIKYAYDFKPRVEDQKKKWWQFWKEESFNSYKVAPDLSSYTKAELVSSIAGPQGTAAYQEVVYDPIAQSRMSAETATQRFKDYGNSLAGDSVCPACGSEDWDESFEDEGRGYCGCGHEFSVDSAAANPLLTFYELEALKEQGTLTSDQKEYLEWTITSTLRDLDSSSYTKQHIQDELVAHGWTLNRWGNAEPPKESASTLVVNAEGIDSFSPARLMVLGASIGVALGLYKTRGD